ncbi:DUF221-domain-containing protein [Metschnikowia bicuspidata]|uniref:DUF221-domain-containing protein n=1 Tax=Metschnikowia bicuspidata TaxID=27322 RepID=A0A4P9ZFJ6_9ASCO|nr:DUF221-domain-containing protein [Metschnikowia bicuspidata]
MLGFASAIELQNYSVSYSFVSYFIEPTKIESFLKNTQAGAAHATYGADIGVLVKHLMTSFILCVVQLLLFCCLRRVLKKFYQPRKVIEDLGGGPDPEGLFNWIFPLWRRKSKDYLDLGLDAYFFLRFIRFLLLFFIISGFVNLSVLIPVNATSSNDTANGLDKFSIFNVSRREADRLNFHFVCSVFTIALFEMMIRREFKYIADVRQKHMNSSLHRSKVSSRVILLGNVPEEYRSIAALNQLFSQFPGGLEHIWLLDEYHKYERHNLYANEAVLEMESFLTALLSSDKTLLDGDIPKQPVMERVMKKLFYPPIILPIKLKPISKQATYVRIPGIFRMFMLQKRVSLVSWSLHTLEISAIALEERIAKLSTGDYEKMDKAFLMFKTQESAYMAHQTLLSPEYGKMDDSLVEVDRNDIIWHNLMRKTGVMSIMVNHIINGMIIILTCLYVVPVSLITLVSQIPLLTQLLPFMGFLKKLPREVGSILSSFLPTLMLSFLTDVQLTVFRILLLMKGHCTGAEIELDLQLWYFVFVFVQQFLVVSVLTSLVVVFVNVVEKPASIPILLAENIPMSAIFFFKFLSVKAFALCGSNFVRLRSLLRWVVITKWVDRTPRQASIRTKQLMRIQWGAVYASFSVYAAIGIIYSTIAPFVSLFMIFLLILFMLYYKHALRYMYSRENSSETNGRLYPRALFQLYTGIYCLEFCMIGILLSLRNVQGEHTMKLHALVVAFVFGLSVSSNVVGYTRFQKLFTLIPQIRENSDDLDEKNLDERISMNLKEQSLLYLHPCYQYQKPTIWLPDNGNEDSEQLILILREYTNAVAGGSTKGNAAADANS